MGHFNDIGFNVAGTQFERAKEIIKLVGLEYNELKWQLKKG